MDDAAVEALAARVAGLSPEAKVDFLLGMLEHVGNERDALQARIDAYEGEVEEWEEFDRMLAASSLGGEEAQRIRDRTPPQIAKALAVAAREMARADEAEAARDRLRAVVEDITAHATPIAEDDDGFVSVGYTVTVGAIHRAIAAAQGMADDPLHPLMPTGEEQVFRDWLDFVERVARPIVETENDETTEQAAMALYRKASPFFICAALVMATNERDRLRAVVEGERELRVRLAGARCARDDAKAERDRLREVAAGVVLALESLLQGDPADVRPITNAVLRRCSEALQRAFTRDGVDMAAFIRDNVTPAANTEDPHDGERMNL